MQNHALSNMLICSHGRSKQLLQLALQVLTPWLLFEADCMLTKDTAIEKIHKDCVVNKKSPLFLTPLHQVCCILFDLSWKWW